MQDEEGTIRMDLENYLKSVKDLTLPRSRSKQEGDKVSKDEYDPYISMTGTIMWDRNGTLLQTSFVAFYMQ